MKVWVKKSNLRCNMTCTSLKAMEDNITNKKTIRRKHVAGSQGELVHCSDVSFNVSMLVLLFLVLLVRLLLLEVHLWLDILVSWDSWCGVSSSVPLGAPTPIAYVPIVLDAVCGLMYLFVFVLFVGKIGSIDKNVKGGRLLGFFVVGILFSKIIRTYLVISI